jgi:hypothetical protein
VTEPVRQTRLVDADTARVGRRRIQTDAENVERDLTKLVLTVVELVRQLVERQCLRRFDQGDLTDDQVERIGLTLMRLEEAMTELCERFGLTLTDLNLDLGPLGTLLPADPADPAGREPSAR